MAQKISYWLLVTLLLSIGFGQLLRFQYFSVPIYLHDVLVLLILILNYWRLLFVNWNLKIGIFLLGLSLGWLFALLNYPFTQLLVPALYTLRLLVYLSLYLLLKRSKFLLPTSYFLISGIIALIIGYSQYFLLPDMRVFQYLGWDDHLNRLTLPHFDPTFSAVMLSMSALYFYQADKGRLAQLFLPAILLTYARSIWVSLIVVGVIYSFQVKKYAKLIVALTLLVLTIIILPKQFGEGTNLLRFFSIQSRITTDLNYVQKYGWDLLIGRGMNTLILDTPSSSIPNHPSGPNNSYLYLLLTSGILGLLGWGMFMFSLYQQSTHKQMLIFFFLASFFNNVMFYPFALLWILLLESNSKSL